MTSQGKALGRDANVKQAVAQRELLMEVPGELCARVLSPGSTLPSRAEPALPALPCAFTTEEHPLPFGTDRKRQEDRGQWQHHHHFPRGPLMGEE